MIRSVQVNFTNGAISRAVRARIDNPAYKNSLLDLVNCRIMPQGSVTRRPGLAVIDELPNGVDYQFEAFLFNESQSYMCIFSGGKVDIYDRILRVHLLTITGAPWTGAMITAESIQVTQQLDTMIVSNPNFETQILKRTGYATFTLGALAFDKDAYGVPKMPFHKYAPPRVQASVSAWSGAITFALTEDWFVPGHVGLWLRFKAVPMLVTGYTDARHVTCNGPGSYPGSPPAVPTSGSGPDPEWDEQAASPLRGWIQCTCFHEQRLALGGIRDATNALWLSSSNGPFNMDLGTGEDSDAIKYEIYADRAVEIRCMVSMLNLQIFALSGEFVVPWFGSTALTPKNFAVKKQSGYGIKNSFARPFDQSTMFVTKTANAMREFAPQISSVIESYAADSVSFMAMDYIRDPVDFDTQMEGVASQEAVAYVTNTDGTVGVLTRVKKENIGGWGLWTTEGQFHRIGVADHEAWALVRRTIAGVQRSFVEVLDPDRWLDFGAVWSGPASNHIGPWPLHAGCSVHCLSNGIYFGQIDVDSSNYITLPIAVSELEIGFNFVPAVTPLVTEMQMPDGISVGIPRRVVRTVTDFLDTGSAVVGGRALYADLPDDDPGAATPLKTGAFEVYHLGWSRQPTVTVTSPDPLPFTVRSIMQDVET